jgi:hypothetical protein
MRLARCLASWLVHTSTSKGRGRGQGLTPYPPTLRVARHQAAYPLPPYPKCPAATLPYPPGDPNPGAALLWAGRGAAAAPLIAPPPKRMQGERPHRL